MDTNKHYDYLIVGSGLFGAVCAYRILQSGKTCLIVDRRSETGGNLKCEDWNGITVHKYGPHVFHTDNETVWNFVNAITPFRQYTHSPVAKAANGKVYSMPFNMWTYQQVWGVSTPEEAKNKINSEISVQGEPSNLEETAISMVGKTIYELLVKSYTEKQWGRKCTELPSSTIKRLPLRMTYAASYFDDKYQAMPEGSYNDLIDGLIAGADVEVCTDYNSKVTRDVLNRMADKVIYTGALDEYFNYSKGVLEYRSLKFETEYNPNVENLQGAAIVNYTGPNEPYTRIVEHKHFTPWRNSEKCTVVTREYPMEWSIGAEQCYPVDNFRNRRLYEEYKKMALNIPNFYFGGRLADYKYYDMDDAIAAALKLDIGL